MLHEARGEDLIDAWTLVDSDWRLVANKHGATRLGFALLLKFFESEARFPRDPAELPAAAVAYVAEQVKVQAAQLSEYGWSDRTATYHRTQIREAFGFRTLTREDETKLAEWLASEICPVEMSDERVREALLARCRAERIEPPGRPARLIAAARSTFEQQFCERTVARLSPVAIERLQDLVAEDEPAGADEAVGRGVYAELKADPGQLGLDTLLREPENLAALKSEIQHRWGTVELLDILKETDWLVDFTDEFSSVASREIVPRDVQRRRLLLCLFALGTNMGISQIVATGDHGETEATLRRTRRMLITRENLRAAIARVVNSTLEIRDRAWWGDGTACASDSQKFGAWSTNFMTEWHAGYYGPGVMIYWHVERKSVCIYSQLKSCSASEVAAMIEGLLRHSTNAEIDRNYTDTHGASVVAFAFAHHLDFRLLPRLKNIGSARLYRPGPASDTASWPALERVLSRPIRWDLIAQQYDQIVPPR